MCCALLPLLHIDFRVKACPLVTCSDASERGGGVVAAWGLSSTGSEALLRRLAALPNLFQERFVLVESCAGLGGARQACALLGVTPALYIVNEVDPDATAVLRHHWPDAKHLGPIEACTVSSMRAVASSAHSVEIVLHIGGTPCPGFCLWNPFAPGAQHDASVRLL